MPYPQGVIQSSEGFAATKSGLLYFIGCGVQIDVCRGLQTAHRGGCHYPSITTQTAGGPKRKPA